MSPQSAPWSCFRPASKLPPAAISGYARADQGKRRPPPRMRRMNQRRHRRGALHHRIRQAIRVQRKLAALAPPRGRRRSAGQPAGQRTTPHPRAPPVIPISTHLRLDSSCAVVGEKSLASPRPCADNQTIPRRKKISPATKVVRKSLLCSRGGEAASDTRTRISR